MSAAVSPFGLKVWDKSTGACYPAFMMVTYDETTPASSVFSSMMFPPLSRQFIAIMTSLVV